MGWRIIRCYVVDGVEDNKCCLVDGVEDNRCYLVDGVEDIKVLSCRWDGG